MFCRKLTFHKIAWAYFLQMDACMVPNTASTVHEYAIFNYGFKGCKCFIILVLIFLPFYTTFNACCRLHSVS